MIKEKLGVHKQYLIVNAPVPFRLIANNGTDFVERPSGIWQLDCYKLLPEKYMKNYPVFNLELEYDETQIPDGFNFTYYFSNLNLGDSLKGVSGDLVELSSVQFEVLKKTILNKLQSYEEVNLLSNNEIILKKEFSLVDYNSSIYSYDNSFYCSGLIRFRLYYTPLGSYYQYQDFYCRFSPNTLIGQIKLAYDNKIEQNEKKYYHIKKLSLGIVDYNNLIQYEVIYSSSGPKNTLTPTSYIDFNILNDSLDSVELDKIELYYLED